MVIRELNSTLKFIVFIGKTLLSQNVRHSKNVEDSTKCVFNYFNLFYFSENNVETPEYKKKHHYDTEMRQYVLRFCFSQK